MFDLDPDAGSRFCASVAIPDHLGPDSDWHVGAIVGPSGSGKSQVAAKAYGKAFLDRFDWPSDRAIVSALPAGHTGKTLTRALGAVGFSSPPDWLRPYHALSTGQRMRCDVARALLTDAPVLAFDELGSTVDQPTRQHAATTIAKAVRQDVFPLRRLVAVTCHYDVLDFLKPCWVLDMADRTLARGWVQRERDRRPGWFAGRPPLRFHVHHVTRHDKRRAWAALARHHYLDHSLHPASTAYAVYVSRQPTALCATINNMGRARSRRVTRLVVSPDYQGLGLGMRLLDAIADHETHTQDLARFSIRTSHPALIAALHRSPLWSAGSRTYNARHVGIAHREGRDVGSRDRATRGYVYQPR
ncbi:MAG: GNAT family N-acetyltransferase [Planctomycetota bacterium]